jgi:hypothetical protein
MKIYTKDEAKILIEELVNHFDKNITQFKNISYKEAQVENDFIRPLFTFLNWNTSNFGLEPERQVFQLQITGKTGDDYNKRPDYLLRIPDKNSNTMKSVFFIEAKKPIYDLKTNTKFIRQVYQYAWSTLNSSDNPNNQVRLTLLTDFEEFRFFDCQDSSPLIQNKFESFNKHIIKDLTYKDYVNKFDELWDLFEYNNVVNGSLDKWYLTAKQLADNRITPDKKFLEDLRNWRLEIARSMHRNDAALDDYRLTKATLLYINRIIFIKMLADRNIETDYLSNILVELNKSKKTEIKLFELCRNIFTRLDHIYNGSIFVFEKDADEIELENSVLKKIFEALKPEESIYTLAAMPVEIIGNVYELFIAEQIVVKGKTLSLVSKFDEKKAGGVYYTPRYIVEYIVDNTLGKKLEECNSPEEVSKIKVLDPACGSGSFLIVAYQKILDWYKKYYYEEVRKLEQTDPTLQPDPMLKHGVDKNAANINPTLQSRVDENAANINPTLQRGDNRSNKADSSKNINPTLQRGVKKDNRWDNRKSRIIRETNSDFYTIHLSHKLKSDILVNNIFGVDIDAQAVLVTKFSLSMKALEDSTKGEVIEDNELFKIPAIPKLENNIKCGNSLIGSDFYLDNRPSLFGEKEKRKINVFDWEKEFPEIFLNKEINSENIISKKIDSHLNAAVEYIESALYHTEKATEYAKVKDNFVVKEETISYVVKNNNTNKGGFDVIIGNPPYRTFQLGRLQKSESDEILKYYQNKFPNAFAYKINIYSLFLEKCNELLKSNSILSFIIPNTFLSALQFKNIRKSMINNGYFSDLIDIRYKVFEDAEIGGNLIFKYIKSFNNYHNTYIKTINIQSDLQNNVYDLANLYKNANEQNNYSFYYDNFIENFIEKIKTIVTPLDNFVTFYQGIITGDNKKFLSAQKLNPKYFEILQGKNIFRYLYEFTGTYILFEPKLLWSNTNVDKFKVFEKLISRQTSDKLIAAYDSEGYFSLDSTHVMLLKDNSYSLKYILGIFNSKLLNYIYKKRINETGRVFAQVKVVNLKQLPIRSINFGIKSEKQMHEKLVSLVEQMLENQKYQHEAKTDSDKKLYQDICDALDKQIDSIIYKLYDLTDEEIKIIERKE